MHLQRSFGKKESVKTNSCLYVKLIAQDKADRHIYHLFKYFFKYLHFYIQCHLLSLSENWILFLCISTKPNCKCGECRDYLLNLLKVQPMFLEKSTSAVLVCMNYLIDGKNAFQPCYFPTVEKSIANTGPDFSSLAHNIMSYSAWIKMAESDAKRFLQSPHLGLPVLSQFDHSRGHSAFHPVL